MLARPGLSCLLALIPLLSACSGKTEELRSAPTEPDAGAEIEDARAEAQQPVPEGGTLHDALPDAPGEAECGTMICIDCGCTCPDGTDKIYGGCFNACESIPEYIKNCSGCSQMCGPNLQPCSADDECAAGYKCYSFAKCSTCQPEGRCLPAPCQPDGCYSSEECAEGWACQGGNLPQGIQGQCLPKAALGQCWKDSDCPEQATCEGESSCPVCQPCNSPTLPGTCRMPAGQESVVLWLPGIVFFSQEPIQPTWFNFLPTPIYLPGCTTYDVEVFDNGTWVDKGSTVDCVWEGVALKVAAGAAQDTHLALVDASVWNYPKFRLKGYWYEGCQEGLPISTAQCAAAHEVLSREFTVQDKPL